MQTVFPGGKKAEATNHAANVEGYVYKFIQKNIGPNG
jgi:hypothetical protein